MSVVLHIFTDTEENQLK